MSSAARSDLVDIEVQQFFTTPKSIRVSKDGSDAEAVWLPLSQIEVAPKGGSKSVVIVTLPEWLAIEKGLV